MTTGGAGTLPSFTSTDVYASFSNTVINFQREVNFNSNNLVNVNNIEIEGTITDGLGGNITFGNGLDLQTNIITNCSLLSTDGIVFSTTPVNDNTQDRLLVVDSISGEVEYRTVASLPAQNPFDQDLNTTDTPTFAKLDITNPTLNNTNFTFAMYNTTSDEIEYRTNFADQNVRTNDNVVFNKIDITNPSLGNTNFTFAMYNTTSDEIEYRTNFADQAVLTSSNVQFANLTLTGDIDVGSGTQTQTTSITSNVTLNGTAGIITTVSTTLGAEMATAFSLFNSSITTTSVVYANIVAYSGTFGTNGLPGVAVDAIGAGGCTIRIYNSHSVNALNGTLGIGFLVLT